MTPRSRRFAWWIGTRVSLLTAGATLIITCFMWVYFQVRDYLLLRSLPPDVASQLKLLRLEPRTHEAELWEFARQNMPVEYLLPGMALEDWITVFLLMAASMPFIAAAALWASGPIARQFASIVRAAKQVAGGNFGASATVVESAPAELAELADTFNNMTARLAQYQREVRDSSAVLAHELRTPLNAALGRLDGLVDGVFPRSDQQLQIISNQLHQMNRLVNDIHLLSLARSGSMHLEMDVFSVRELVDERLSWLSHLNDTHQVQLIVHVDPNLTISADRDRIGQVLTVLLDNAIRHGGGEGAISVQASATDAFVEIAVSDSGPGVAPHELKHLSDRFWRGDASRSRHSGGSGLGLSIAAAICEAHRGRLVFANGIDAGLVCTVQLPRQV